ncbi:hypothetical protein [Tenacibaculum agarivorans]|uniref:hypothetical protein n=1 Tax=Tenacibaculum agarivorans TaxID=1908389 RepID=UPI000A43ECF3|nr:hypothetical protein [Tenacibaculum agarivorans]
MKYLRLVILSMTVLIMSCTEEKETIQVLETFEKEIVNKKGVKGGNKIPINTPYSRDQEDNMMYMTSYLIGLTLLGDENAREYFYQQVSGKTFKISLRTLLSGGKNPFKTAFRGYYYIYNWNTDYEWTPTPPVSSAIPDPLEKDYGVLQIGYSTYLDLISNDYDWQIDLPNKAILFSYFNFTQYLDHKQYIINLWTKDNSLYDDGLKMSNNDKFFIPDNFDYEQELDTILILTLRNTSTSLQGQ